MASKIDSNYLLSDIELQSHFKVFAGPGAGKTHFLVNNIKNIIHNNKAIKNSKDRKILCITYTNSAVDIITERLEDYKSNVIVCTIHNFIIQYVIKPYQDILKKIIKQDFDINIDSKRPIMSQIEGLGIFHGFDKDDIYNLINKISGTEEALKYGKKSLGDVQINIEEYIKNNNNKSYKHSKKIKSEHIKAIKYLAWNKANKLSHDEILYFGHRIVTTNELITYILRVQFPFIFVDEFQDTNPLQSLIIQQLGRKGTVVGVIGDIAQSIYSFQGARPSFFTEFDIDGEINEFEIPNNRRSTNSIVCLCNYIRKQDGLIQESQNKEGTKVVLLFGKGQELSKKINDEVEARGAIITRTWASAFNHIYGVKLEQKDLLRRIYNSYYYTSIDIRSDISEHNNVPWVRAFKFIILLNVAFKTKSVLNIINATSLYIDSKSAKKSRLITPQLILTINELLEILFENVEDETLTVSLIDKFNMLLNKEQFINVKQFLSTYMKNKESAQVDFITTFSELEREDLIENVSKLHWITSVKLFDEVFSDDSKYMTVHQSKGNEWDSVVVSMKPSQFDKTSFIDMILDPCIKDESPQDEFTRMFYVACSRARKNLFVHIDNVEEVDNITKALDEYISANNLNQFYEVRLYNN